MVNELHAFLRQQSPAWGLPGGEWKFWVYNNSHPHYSNIDVMWFHGNDEFPRVITKLDRRPSALAREYQNLAKAHAAAPGYVPRPLNYSAAGDFWALWMEGLDGLPFQSEDCGRSLDSVIDMLAEIHCAVCGPNLRSASARYQDLVAKPLESISRYTDSAVVRQGCARLAEQADSAWLDSIPAMPQHGDLFPGNIILSRGRPSVLDWETFGVVDLPFFDLVTFFTALIWPPGMSFAPDSDLLSQIPKLVRRYSDRTGANPAELNRLLPLALINWFHLMFVDGRQRITSHLHAVTAHYFSDPGIWLKAFGVDTR